VPAYRVNRLWRVRLAGFAFVYRACKREAVMSAHRRILFDKNVWAFELDHGGFGSTGGERGQICKLVN
jgi:hypothetical protein